MLRALSRIILQPKKVGMMKWNSKVNIHLNTFPHKNALEKNTFSQKVVEYMRGNPEYAASFISLPEHFNCSSTVKTFERHQLLLVIAHGSESKPNDILELFTQYTSHKQNITQDLIKRSSLMSLVKEKVHQAIPLMTQNELKNFAILLKNVNYEKSRYLMNIVGRIDEECCQRAAEADLEQCLELFDILLLLHGNNICRREQFDIFMSLFEMHTTAMRPHHLVQLFHYIGVAKKRKLYREYVQCLINKLETTFEHLSFIDAGIAVGGMFRCDIKLDKSSSIIKETAKRLQMKAEQSESLSDLESYAFVAMVKIIRAAKYHDQALLSSMNTFIMKSATDTLQPEMIAHTLALYANSQVYDEEVFTKLECSILNHLTGSLQNVRAKDISRILWSFSHVGHKGSGCFLECIENALLRFVQKGDLKFTPEHLSGSLYSLAVLGHYPEELIKKAFQPQLIEKLKGYQRSKQLSRLLALHQAVKIEAPGIIVSPLETHINDLPKRTLADEMRYRPTLAHLMKGAKFINKSVGSSVLELKFPIPLINYASLVFEPQGLKNQDVSGNSILEQLTNCKKIIGSKKVAIEIIDSQSLVIGNMDIIGIVKIKLRLMSHCGWVVHKLYEDDVNRFNNDEQTMGAFIIDILSNLKL